MAAILIRLRWLLLILCAIHLVRYWVAPGFDSLWMDETGSWWTIADGWRELWVRTGLHPNSRLYGAILLGWSQLAGTSEIMLRLPSLAAMLGAVAALGMWLEQRFGGGVGWAAAAMCLASPKLSFFALDARPYALAVLLLVVATAAWMSLWREWSLRSALVWVVSAGLLVHVQPVVSTALLGHVAWIAVTGQWRGCDRRRWVILLAMFAGAVLIAAPEVLRLAAIKRGVQTAQIPPRSFAWGDLRLVFPLAMFGPALVTAVLVTLGGQWGRDRWSVESRRHVAMGICMIAACACALTGYALLRRSNTMLDRYAIAVDVGWLFAMGALIAAVRDVRGRVWLATCYSALVLAASAWVQGWKVNHADADWRRAMAAVRTWERREALPLLLHSGFVEAAHVRLLHDPQWTGFLQAPVLYYRHAGPTHTLPYYVLKRHQAYFDEVVERMAGKRFAAVVYDDPAGSSRYVSMIARRHGEPRLLGHFRRLAVYVFEPR